MNNAKQIAQWREWTKNGFHIFSKPSVSALVDLLEQQQAQIETLTQENKNLTDYHFDQEELPLGAFNGTRELVHQIKNDALDMGGCYEVSTGLLDQLFENYKDKNALQLLAQRDLATREDECYVIINRIKQDMCLSKDMHDLIVARVKQLKNRGEL